jgi:outer membrane protein assembly factor BamB
MIQRKRSRYSQPLLAVLLVGFLTLAFAVSSTATEQLVLQKSGTNPQTRAAENYLDEANQNTVNADALQVKSSTNANQRSLILFDFSLLPNVGIKTAVLTLTVQTAPTATRTYDAFPLDSLFAQSAATWKTRVADLAWGAAGGDIPGTATTSTTVTNRTAAASWTITPDVQSWYTGNANGVPVPNYGTLIMDSAESSATAYQTVFYSNSAVTPADAPSLTVTFVQNVANLAATAGNAQVALSWTFPAAIGTVVDKTTGVLILRRAGEPVDKGSVPTDGTTYALCATVGTGTVVFNNTALSTTFTDSSSDTCGAPANGTTYYYKVFTQDSAHNYSTSGTSGDGGSLTVPEDSATPSASAPYSSNWMTATYSTTLAPPSLFPGLVAMLGTQTNFMFSVNPNTGMRSYPPLSLGGAITGRSPVIDAADSSLAEDMVYVADQSGLAYGIAADTGQTVWAVDPLNSGGTPFLAAGALLVKSYATSSYTLSHDLLVLGTRNSSTLTGNAIVAVDGNTGATIWTDVGDTGTIPAMDIITATPTISYTANTIWVTSESNGGTQPSLWELNANTGKVLATLSLGDIDSSPVLSPDGTTLFVGTDAGTVYAINTSTAAVITSIAGGDGEIVSYPLVVGPSSPYTVVFSGIADVHCLTYNSSTQTFTANWTTVITTPSAPIGVYGLTDIYVGSGDGKIHELNINTGVDTRDIVANTGQPGVVGDPGLDISLMHIYVSTNDQRMYSFTFPY